MRKRGGFTLVELLVVIGIIAVLIGILIPTLSRAKDQAVRVQCMADLRQVTTAINMYASENRNSLPYCNWGDPPNIRGWLYSGALGSKPGPEKVETGVLYPYLKTTKVFKCPAHTELRSGGLTETMTSYLMNGAVCDYSGGPPNRITKFQPRDVILWESGETRLMNNGPPFNDGSSYPGEWLSERHGGRGRKAGNIAQGTGLASTGFADGHIEMIYEKDYIAEATKPGRNRWWCAPNLPGGGH